MISQEHAEKMLAMLKEVRSVIEIVWRPYKNSLAGDFYRDVIQLIAEIESKKPTMLLTEPVRAQLTDQQLATLEALSSRGIRVLSILAPMGEKICVCSDELDAEVHIAMLRLTESDFNAAIDGFCLSIGRSLLLGPFPEFYGVTPPIAEIAEGGREAAFEYFFNEDMADRSDLGFVNKHDEHGRSEHGGTIA